MAKIKNNYNIRAIALDVLTAINNDKEYSHKALNTALKIHKDLSRADRSFLSKLIHGTIERQLSIDYVISNYSSVKLGKIKDTILQILRLSVYQIMYMDRIPDSAVCDEAVKLSAKRGFTGLKAYVNGVLRNISRNKENIIYPDISIRYSMPQWIIDMLGKKYDNSTLEQILQEFLNDKELCVRVNLSKVSFEELEKSLSIQSITYTKSSYCNDIYYLSNFENIADIEAINKSWISIQDLSSSMVARLAGIKTGDTVIEVCAAPGGKTIHSADILNGSGKVLSFDISEAKIKLINEQVHRAGFDNVYVAIADASIEQKELIEKADVLIADLPCSGLGIIGRKPDIKYNISREIIDELLTVQRNILDNVSKYVKKGGRLIYSTCTLSDKENIENRKYFLERHKDFVPVDLSEDLKAFDCVTATEGYIEMLPHKYKSDGFFVSVYEKRL